MRSLLLSTAMVIVLVAVAGGAFAADKAKSSSGKKDMMMMEMTKEKRQDMAMAHEKMATCLRSETPFEDCRKEMKTFCQDNMGYEGCGMMGDKKHRGMMDEK